MSHRHLVLILWAVGLFVSGVAVGQKTGRSKFAKYQQPAYIRSMDWNLLQATVSEMEAHLPFEDGIGTPRFYFDPDGEKVRAVVIVDARELEAEPAGKVIERLQLRAGIAEGTARAYLPDLVSRDFELEFDSYGDKAKEAGKGHYIYAEYKNGQLTVH